MTTTTRRPDVNDSVAAATLFSEFGRALDTKNWQAYAALYGSHGSLSLSGNDPVPQAELEGICEAVLGCFRETHHMITNVLSTPDGAVNRVTANLRATHFYPEDGREPWVVGGRYVATTKDSGEGLLFEDVELITVWQTGDPPTAG